MTVFSLVNAPLYIAGHDFTADSNQIQLTAEADVLDRTTFRPTTIGWRDKVMGLKRSELSASGFWQSAAADAVDPEVFNNLGVTGRVTTMSDVETEGSAAYMLKHMPAQYQVFGEVGPLAPFTLQGVCSDNVGVIGGKLLKAFGTVNATGAIGTGVQIGAVGATQSMYATLHLMGTAGTTITVVLESATANTFVGATTRGTFGPLTVTGGTWMTPAAGAITDTWWRLRVTAITGTWTVAGAAGIR